MHWFISETRTVLLWWSEWKFADLIWQFLFGGTVMSAIAYVWAAYRHSEWRRELRGLVVGLSLLSMLCMGSLLVSRPASSRVSDLGWPRITTQQRDSLLATFEGVPVHPVFISCLDENCDAFTQDLKSIFLQLGWPVHLI